MKYFFINTSLVLLLLAGFVFPVLGNIQTGTVGNSCNPTENSCYRIQGTLGQSIVGFSQSDSRISKTGFWTQIPDFTTDTDLYQIQTPLQFELKQNYPNPFNPETVISFSVSKSCQVDLVVYDIQGRKISTPVSEHKTPGEYTIVFQQEDLPSGIYIYTIEMDKFRDKRKMLLLK